MPRSIPEWVGKTPDTKIPPRVCARLYDRSEGRCRSCTRQIGGKLAWETDHIQPLIMCGENRESNLQCLCVHCHAVKTKKDVADKALAARGKAKHLGLKQSRWPAMAGTKRSGWRRRMDGTTERRDG